MSLIIACRARAALTPIVPRISHAWMSMGRTWVACGEDAVLMSIVRMATAFMVSVMQNRGCVSRSCHSRSKAEPAPPSGGRGRPVRC
jgi:hypothetical protein